MKDILTPIIEAYNNGGTKEELEQALRSIAENKTIPAPQQNQFQTLMELIALEASRPCVLFFEDTPISWFDLSSNITTFDFTLTSEGQYKIQLITGRMLWKAKLSKQDVFIHREEESLPAAAETDESETAKYQLVDGLSLNIIPGIDRGILRITKQ